MGRRKSYNTAPYELIIIAVIAVIVLGLAIGPRVYQSVKGNKTFIDTTYNYKSAIVKLPDDTLVKGSVENWSDYEDGDQIQVTIDGTTYLVHSSNIVLMTK